MRNEALDFMMSIVDSVIDSEQKNKILNEIGVKRNRQEAGFTQGISAYFEPDSEADEPESATAAVEESKKQGIKETRAQKQKGKDAGMPRKKK